MVTLNFVYVDTKNTLKSCTHTHVRHNRNRLNCEREKESNDVSFSWKHVSDCTRSLCFFSWMWFASISCGHLQSSISLHFNLYIYTFYIFLLIYFSHTYANALFICLCLLSLGLSTEVRFVIVNWERYKSCTYCQQVNERPNE